MDLLGLHRWRIQLHYLLLYEVLLNSASNGVIVAEFFRGLLGAVPPPVGWIFFEG